MNILEIAKACAPHAKHHLIGIRPGEKLHEQLIGAEDALHTYEYDDYFKIIPSIHSWGRDSEQSESTRRLVDPSFRYVSNENKEWMSHEKLSEWIDQNLESIGTH